MSKDERVVGTSFSDLDPEDFPEWERTSSDIDNINLDEIDFSLSEEEGQKVQENAESIRKWVQNHLAKLDSLYSAPKAIRVRAENQEKAKKIKDKLDNFLHHSEEGYRQAAWAAFLAHKFTTCQAASYKEAMTFLNRLVENGYLEEGNGHSPLEAWRRKFRVPREACFSYQEFREVKEALKEMVNRVVARTARKRASRVEELSKEAELTPEELFLGEDKGTSLIYVPAEIAPGQRGGKEEFFRRDDGFLYVKATGGGRICLLEGIGSFDVNVEEAHSLGTYVPKHQLDWDYPLPGSKLCEVLAETCFDEKEIQGKIKKYHFSWHLLKRAKEGLEHRDERKEEKLVLSKGATVPAEEFFLEGKSGIVLVDFRGVWREENIWNLCFLLERTTEGQIRIVEVPDYLKDFFSDCMETYPEGRKFQGAPQPLQTALQAVYGQEQTRSLLSS